MTWRHLFFTLLYITIAFSSFCQTELTPVWDNGLRFKSNDGATSIKVGGRIHYDVGFASHSKALDSIAGPAHDKLEVRRARISFEGTLKNALKYEFEFTFSERIRFADLYLAFLKIPFIEQLTVGHFREPYGMEENTSSNSIVFMERSLTSSFSPGRNAGIMVQKPFFDKRLRIYSGVFRITDPVGSDPEAEGKHSYTTRVAYLPLWDSTRNKALHFGLASNMYTPPKSTYLLNVENETHTGGPYIKSGEIRNVDKVKSFGSELGYTYKRLTLQSEYMHSLVTIKDIAGTEPSIKTRDFNSFYAMASVFVGEGQRQYDRDGNRFSSISRGESKKGVWEFALRYSRIFLKESIEDIKKMNDITLGANWYYSQTTRVMFNYIFSRIENRHTANAFQMRLQVAF